MIQVLCQYLLTLTSDVNGRPLPKKQPALARDAQQLAVRLLQENVVKHYEILSLDIISNGLSVLADLGAVYRDKRSVSLMLLLHLLFVCCVCMYQHFSRYTLLHCMELLLYDTCTSADVQHSHCTENVSHLQLFNRVEHSPVCCIAVFVRVQE